MNAITSEIARTYDTLLKNYYSKKQDARRDVSRSNYSKNELAEFDSNAVAKAAKSFRDMEYSTKNGTNVYNNIKAFVTSYNNLVGSLEGSSDYSLTRNAKLLKNVLKDNKDALSEIGIDITSSGKLNINKTTLADTNPNKIKRLFGEDSDLPNKLRFYANKIYKSVSSINLSTQKYPVSNKQPDADDDSSTSTIDLFL